MFVTTIVFSPWDSFKTPARIFQEVFSRPVPNPATPPRKDP